MCIKMVKKLSEGRIFYVTSSSVGVIAIRGSALGKNSLVPAEERSQNDTVDG